MALLPSPVELEDFIFCLVAKWGKKYTISMVNFVVNVGIRNHVTKDSCMINRAFPFVMCHAIPQDLESVIVSPVFCHVGKSLFHFIFHFLPQMNYSASRADGSGRF